MADQCRNSTWLGLVLNDRSLESSHSGLWGNQSEVDPEATFLLSKETEVPFRQWNEKLRREGTSE